MGQLNGNCTVSALNRTARVKADGSWIIPNIPANFGQVRARATCVENASTHPGQSDFFRVPPKRGVDVPEIPLATPDPVPASVGVTASTTLLTTVGATTQLVVIATFGASPRDVGAAGTGTNSTTSNAAVATVSADGLVTAVSSGTVIVSAMNEGALGVIRLQVTLTGDTDGDGIPDDVELANGLNPNDPIDGLEDPDGDGLTNKQELVDFATNRLVADTDGDGINDGDEVAGKLGYVTDPALADTDGDGIRDWLEIQTGSDPTDPTSYNLASALQSLDVRPLLSALVASTTTEISEQLVVMGLLRDGTSIDLTSPHAAPAMAPAT